MSLYKAYIMPLEINRNYHLTKLNRKLEGKGYLPCASMHTDLHQTFTSQSSHDCVSWKSQK